MYALFFEENHESIGVFDTKTQAMVMGRLMSREKGRTVVGVFNRADGSTAVCCKFTGGEQAFEGAGGSPIDSITGALEGRVQET